MVWEARTIRDGGRRRKVQGGVGGCLATRVKGLPSPCWDPPSPSGLEGSEQSATPMGRSGAARCFRQGAVEVHKGLPSREMIALPPPHWLLCQNAVVLKNMKWFRSLCVILAQGLC